jgi:hypothetical protein
LRESLFGPWGASTNLAVHDSAYDPTTVTERPDGVFEATVGLTADRARAVLSSLADRLPPPSLEPPFDEPLRALHAAAIVHLVCERERVLFQSDCALPDVESAIAATTAITATLRLRSHYEGGYPVGADGRPLRAPAARLERQGADGVAVPVGGFVLVADDPRDPTGPRIRANTDEHGIATFPSVADGAPTLHVELDREGLFGPLAPHFAALETRLQPRPIDAGRYALVVSADLARDDASRSAFANELERALRERGARPVRLDPDWQTMFSRAQTDRRPELSQRLADEQAGRIDVLLVATVESVFASRMGTSRVWYEAKATVVAVNAYSGHPITTIEARTTAPGFGDARAEAEARTALGRTIAERIIAEPLLQIRSRSGPSARRPPTRAQL